MGVCACVCVTFEVAYKGWFDAPEYARCRTCKKEQNSPGDTNVATQITRSRRALAGSRQDLANVRGRDGEIDKKEYTPTPRDCV